MCRIPRSFQKWNRKKNPGSGKWFFNSKKSSRSKFFDQFLSIFCLWTVWMLLACRNCLLCLFIWLWCSRSHADLFFHQFCLIFDILSVRKIRTQLLRRILTENHHYPSTNVISGILGPVFDLFLRFQGTTASQHAILDFRTACQMQWLVENLSLNDRDS